MKIIIVFTLLCAMATAYGAEKNIEFKDIPSLEKAIKKYNILYKRRIDLQRQNKSSRSLKLKEIINNCFSLRRTLQKHFIGEPEDFLKVDFKAIQLKPFTSIALNETFEAEAVYCEIIWKFIDERHISSIQLMSALSRLAGSPEALYLLKRSLPYISKLKKSWVKGIRGRIVRMEFQVEMYENLAELNKKNTKDWKAYSFSYENKYRRLKGEVDREIAEIEGEKDWEIKALKLTEKMPDLHPDKNPVKFFNKLPTFAKGEEKEIEFDFLKLFKLILSHGGKMTEMDDLNILYGNVIMIKDKKGRLRYVISYSTTGDAEKDPIFFYGPVYDLINEVTFVAAAQIYPHSSNVKQFFKNNFTLKQEK